MPRRIGNDELALVGREKSIGHVDGNALLALGGEAIDQQREVDVLALGAVFFRVSLDRGHLVFEQHLGLEQQAPDQGALAVVHAAAGDETQQALVLVAAQVFANVGGDEIGYMGH